MTRRLALCACALVVIALPVIHAMQTAAKPQFEVASVKPYKDDGGPRGSITYGPDGIVFEGLPLAFIIGEAYNFPVGRMQGPDSLTKEALWGPLREPYVVRAKANHAVPKDQLLLMLQSLLADRFKLVLHREAKDGPVYRLVVAKGGAKLDVSQAKDAFSMSGSSEGWVFHNAEMMRLTGFLSGQANRTVVDQTGLVGLYNFILKRPADLTQDLPGAKPDGRSPESQSAAAFADALSPLGLQLIAGTAPVDYLVIDHVERPSAD